MANAHDALAIGGFLRASGVMNSSYQLTWTDTAVEEQWTVNA